MACPTTCSRPSTLKRLLVARAAELTIGELLAYLRLSGHDPKLFVDCAPALRVAARTARGEEREDLVLAIARVWDGYLPIREGDAVANLVAELATSVAGGAAEPPDEAEAEPGPDLLAEDPFDVITGSAPRLAAGPVA